MPVRHWRRPLLWLVSTAAVIATVAAAAVLPTAQAAQPGSPLLAYLNRISGQYTLSGQHNREPNSDPTKYTRVAQQITGQTPGLWGGDFLFASADVNARQTMINEAINQWRSGSVVALTWHMCPPTVGRTCGWDEAGILGSLTDAQWSQLITGGTALNNAWKARLDEVVPFLQQLKSAGVEPLWRPIHEMNDGWSWWGGRPGASGSRRLYEITYDYLVNVKGLNNMVWVWNVKDLNMGSAGQYVPAANTFDVASLDVWVKLEPSASDYQTMLNLSGGKPISLAEVGRTPSPSILTSQPRWTWFMVWAEWLTDPAYNTNASVQATYFHPRVLNRGEFSLGTPPTNPPTSNPPGGNLALNRPVLASSQENSTNTAARAVDGNTGTRWSSAYADQQWLYVDLGANRSVTGVTVRWEAAYAAQYQIQTSTDGTTWTTVHSDYNGNGGTDTVNFTATTARYVKLYAPLRATQYGVSFWEFEVRGT
jgi:mannan endo-1,4-beta-mannosidase